MSKLKILLADDHEVILDGLNALLEGEPDLEVIATAASGIDTLSRIKELPRPDLLVLDINMPDMDGIEVTTKVKRSYPKIKILILSMHNRPEFVKKLVREGADGYILKNSGKQELLTAIREIASGGTYFSQEIMQTSFKEMFRESTGQISSLSQREKEVVREIAQGLSSREISEKLNLSVHTVDSHRKHILAKTGAKNSTDITLFALRAGIVKGFDIT